MPALRKPNELKLLEGRKVDHDSPQLPPLDEYRVPDTLGDRGRELWERVVDGFKATRVLQVTDRAALEALCVTWDTYCVAMADVRVRGQLVESIRGEGDMVRNPSIMIANAALERWHRLAASFGLTPCDRARLDAGTVEAELNPLEEIIAASKRDRIEVAAYHEKHGLAK